MTKEFKTIDELVTLLESRGVRVDQDTASAIERESYYAIVNGYKAPFLDKEAMNGSSDDVYRNGVEFRWMYDLFLFDRDLRSITFKYLTRAEAVMRTAVSYAFSHHHDKPDAYLERSSFCAEREYLVPKAFKGNRFALYTRNLNDLMTRLNNKVALNSKSRDFIRHYVNKYGMVPLWVLANDLTFGNVIHFYQLMRRDERRETCSTVARCSQRSKARGYLTERALLRASNVLNGFRNLCAHDERLYCTRVGSDDFSVMTTLMFDMLPEDEVRTFVNEVIALIKSYGDRLQVVTIDSLLRDMGFNVYRRE